ncbi:MAG: PIG-L family deacetylase [Defluviitaleaceae bacterium]|nr:PIG-L family deacetylase [Defluviitaleaceae bacterium]MCL2275590.1 PIG-L family deacetylase [Defluviitaleaceae bacterium]
MQFSNAKANVYVPSGETPQQVFPRTTHLCIGAHQDDIEIMAYGAIAACYGAQDKHFTGVTVTDGGGSPRAGVYANYTDEQMKQIRLLEQNSAAQIGRYTAQVNLAWASSGVKDPANHVLIDELKAIIKNTAPQVIFTHNVADKHDTHVAVAMHAVRALREIKGEGGSVPKLVGMEVWRALDWLCDEDKIVQDNAPFPNVAAALLGVYDSQISGGKRYDLASMGRRLANATFFASHAVDDYESAAFGLDMTALVTENADPVAFIEEYIEKFRLEVEKRIRQFA